MATQDLKISLNLTKLKEAVADGSLKVFTRKNGEQFVSFYCNELKSQGQFGDTHSLSVKKEDGTKVWLGNAMPANYRIHDGKGDLKKNPADEMPW